jgi:hypothetical protein
MRAPVFMSYNRSLPQSLFGLPLTVSHAGFFILSQCGERPERYGESSRFKTVPSSASLEAEQVA